MNLLPSSDNPLEYGYFSFLLILLVISVVVLTFGMPAQWQRRLRGSFRGRFSTEHENYYSIKEYTMSSFEDALFSALPGIFLILGLSGTFLSLGHVLGDLKLAMGSDSPNVRDSITATLENLGSKFKISIWGIACNLVFRVIYYYFSAHVLHKLIIDSLQEIKIARDEIEIRKTARNDLIVEANTQFQRNLLDSANDSKESLSKIAGSFVHFDNVIERLRIQIDGFANTTKVLITALEGAAHKFSETAEQFEVTVDNLDKNTSTAFREFTQATNSLNSSINESFDRFAASVAGTLQYVREELSASNQESTEMITGAFTKLEPLLGALVEQMKQMKVLTSDLEFVISRLDNKMTLLEKTNEGFTESINSNLAVITTMNIGVRELQTRLNDNLGKSGPLHSSLSNIEEIMIGYHRSKIENILTELQTVNSLIGRRRN
ncbi:hypothetical protein MUK70_19150 [Dyadobacter chenwenxiniae]|uniref:MotA/TolQ/ExbB proton channel family protein n=1 Tax=Dyadobacter chenwenxiniae TaxID=2906456 RepID=A0A9X1TE61_9BACT|nr:hypothetical protein [Dyadobacter chenwenxiniae]MCF0061359.1 hypothetical protein [Dyadobacter chenwenxiniae]UON81181.1 hypothetical protein MUK70_19150 [Dyadobacter chenwenxiniae]